MNQAGDKKFILRLSKYKRVLQQFKALGMERVFSNNLGDAIDVTPTTVRKDFAELNIPGSKRGGYVIDEVLKRVNELLEQDKPKKLIVVGCGKIGTALLMYKGFEQDGLMAVAGFDIDPKKIDPNATIPIFPLEELKTFVKKNNIKVGIISVPAESASRVLDLMIEAGIRGVLNFAPVELKYTKRFIAKNDHTAGCIIHNMHISPELINLFFLVKKQEE
ncbi:MAG: redox-sensing transcriptional repressor Rex [Spirochaetes bacterium]|nr:MAG: redox-sensing transcriptional repressor Rex [Spirochaetota bacterium]